MSKPNEKTYYGRLMAGRPCAGQRRYVASKRTALDGKVWWCIFDHKKNEYIAGCRSVARYLMADYIERAIRKGELEVEPSDYETV